MTDVAYDDFLSEVMPFVHGCSDLVAAHAVRNAVIEFCEKTDWWVYEIDPIPGMVNVQDYDLDDLPDNTSVVRLLNAWFDGARLINLSMDELRGRYGLSWRQLDPGFPRFVTQVMPDQVTLVPIPGPGLTGAITAFVSLRPTRASTTCDGSILERWAEVVGQGALSRLYATVAQPFSNPGAAAVARSKFNAGVAEARRERLRGLGRGGDRVQMPRFV